MVLAFLFAFLWNVVEPIVDLILKRMKADASEAKKAEANELFDTENLTDILNVDADENRRFRSFFFLVQSMTLTLNFGQIFIWDVSSESFSSPFCRVAYITTAPFMKAVVFPMFYCLNYLHDSSGKLLYHNPLTDSSKSWTKYSLYFFVALIVLCTICLLAMIFSKTQCWQSPASIC